MKSIINGETTFFAGGHFILNATSGEVTKSYGGIAVRKYIVPQTTTLTYLIGDQLGSTSVAVDSVTGEAIETLYKPWGEVRWTTENKTLPTRYTFTGQYSYMADDATDIGSAGFGLMFYNARWYDPQLGRFAQGDTVAPSGTQGTDRYAYVSNNPVNGTDPSGHRCVGLPEECLEDDGSMSAGFAGGVNQGAGNCGGPNQMDCQGNNPPPCQIDIAASSRWFNFDDAMIYKPQSADPATNGIEALANGVDLVITIGSASAYALMTQDNNFFIVIRLDYSEGMVTVTSIDLVNQSGTYVILSVVTIVAGNAGSPPTSVVGRIEVHAGVIRIGRGDKNIGTLSVPINVTYSNENGYILIIMNFTSGNPDGFSWDSTMAILIPTTGLTCYATYHGHNIDSQ